MTPNNGINPDSFVLALCIMGVRYFRIFSTYFRLKKIYIVGDNYFIKWAKVKPLVSIIER